MKIITPSGEGLLLLGLSFVTAMITKPAVGGNMPQLPGKQELKWTVTVKKHFVFHTLEKDPMSEGDFAFHENVLQQSCRKLEIALPKFVTHYYKYPDNKTKGCITKDYGNGIACLSGPPDDKDTVPEIHTIYARDNHELIHILMLQYGIPLPLLSEGIAVFMSGSWQKRPIAQYNLEILNSKKYIPLEKIIDSKEFYKNELISYSEAAGFTGFITIKWGVEKFKELYKSSAQLSNQKTVSHAFKNLFSKIYRIEFEKAEKEWLKKISNEDSRQK